MDDGDGAAGNSPPLSALRASAASLVCNAGSVYSKEQVVRAFMATVRSEPNSVRLWPRVLAQVRVHLLDISSDADRVIFKTFVRDAAAALRTRGKGASLPHDLLELVLPLHEKTWSGYLNNPRGTLTHRFLSTITMRCTQLF